MRRCIVAHADEIWMAVMGPDTPVCGEVGSCDLRANQGGKTVAEALGQDVRRGTADVGTAVEAALE